MAAFPQMIDDGLMRLSLAAAVVGSVLPGAADASLRIPFFDVTLGTLGMAVAGSLIAFAYGTPVESRRKLFGYAVGGIFIGLWCAQLVPHVMGWAWYTPAMQSPVAGIFALLSRWVVPLVIEQVPALYRRIFNTGAPK
ncbi:MAG TPA: hypothetical protein VIG97_14580 [Luteimonas sp.]